MGPRLGPEPRPVPEFVCLSITFEKQGEIPESQMVDGTMQGYRLEPVGRDPEGPGTSLAGHGVQAVVQPQCSLCEGVPSSLTLPPPCSPSHSSRLSRNTRLSFQCYRAASH